MEDSLGGDGVQCPLFLSPFPKIIQYLLYVIQVCHTVSSSFHPVPHSDFNVSAAQTGKYNQGKIGCGGKRERREKGRQMGPREE